MRGLNECTTDRIPLVHCSRDIQRDLLPVPPAEISDILDWTTQPHHSSVTLPVLLMRAPLLIAISQPHTYCHTVVILDQPHWSTECCSILSPSANMARLPSLFLATLLLALLVLSVSAGHGKNAMLLQDVSTLIFTKGEMTAARRSSAQPQLTCKGGKCQYAPESAMCRNIGFDGSDVTWQCEAELPKGLKFGKVEVSCEGFGSRDDEYVLKGSCGLEYTLVGDARFDSEVKEEDSWWNRNVKHTAGKHPSGKSASSSWWSWATGAQAAAAEQYGHAQNYAQHQYDKASDYMHQDKHHSSRHGHHSSQDSFGLFGIVTWLISSVFSMGVKAIAALIVFFVLWKLLRPAATVQQHPAARRPGMFRSLLGMFGSGLGGAGNNYGNSPPPYNPPPYEASGSGYDKRQYYSAAQQQQQQAQQASGGGYGGILQVLGGSLFGYFMGQRRAGQQQPAATYTQQPSTVHHVHHNAPPVNPAYGRNQQQAYPTASATRADGRTTRADGSSVEDVSDVRTTETSTAYARTKRR